MGDAPLVRARQRRRQLARCAQHVAGRGPRLRSQSRRAACGRRRIRSRCTARRRSPRAHRRCRCPDASGRGRARFAAQPFALRRSPRRCGASALSATVRPSRASDARYTRPMPPRPELADDRVRADHRAGRQRTSSASRSGTRSRTGSEKCARHADVFEQRQHFVADGRIVGRFAVEPGRGARSAVPVERRLEQIADAPPLFGGHVRRSGELAKQPGARERPSPLERRRRHAERVGRFLDAEAGEDTAARRCAPVRDRCCSRRVSASSSAGSIASSDVGVRERLGQRDAIERRPSASARRARGRARPGFGASTAPQSRRSAARRATAFRRRRAAGTPRGRAPSAWSVWPGRSRRM